MSNAPGQQPTSPGAEHGVRESNPAFLTVFPSIMLSMFLAVADQTIVATALPAIAAATGDVKRASWVVVAYLIGTTVAAPIYGRLGDAFGRRRMLFAALTVFIVASILCAAAPTILLLTGARLLQGLGGGGLMTLSQALIGETIAPRERARYQGYIAAVAVSANTFGPVAGGILTEHFGWQAIFLINVPLGIGAFILAARLPVSKSDRSNWQADRGGLLYFTVFVATTLLALEQVQRADIGDLPMAVGLLTAGLVALVLLVRQENRVAAPLLPFGLLRMPAIWRSDAMAACHGAALVSLITFLPVYLEVVRGTSPSATGLLLLPLTVGIGTGSLVTGRLVSLTGRTMVFPVTGLALLTANMVLLALWAPSLGTAAFAFLLLSNGLFMGTVMGVVQVTVQSTAGTSRLGQAAASVQFSRSIGAAFGTALVGTVLFAFLTIKNPEAARILGVMVERGSHAVSSLTTIQRAVVQADITEAFRAAFFLIAGFTAAGFFLALTNPMRRI